MSAGKEASFEPFTSDRIKKGSCGIRGEVPPLCYIISRGDIKLQNYVQKDKIHQIGSSFLIILKFYQSVKRGR